MSRLSAVINDLELGAKRLGMSIEDAVLILLGKHPTHSITAQVKVEVPVGNAAPVPETQSSGSSTATAQTVAPVEGASAETAPAKE